MRASVVPGATVNEPLEASGQPAKRVAVPSGAIEITRVTPVDAVATALMLPGGKTRLCSNASVEVSPVRP